jgi:hypothetical protein
VVEVQRIWLIGDGLPEQGGAQVILRQTDAGSFALRLGSPGTDGSRSQEIDLDVARALAQAVLEACEVAAALEQP